VKTPNPGAHPDHPEHDYRKWPLPSISLLKGMVLRTPAAVRAEIGVPSEPTDAMRFGTAGHCYMLDGPDAFTAKYAWTPHDVPDDRRRRAWKEWAASVEGKEIIPLDWYERILAAATAVGDHPIASELLMHAETELSLVWEGADKCLMKGRVDAVSDHIALDLKFSGKTKPDDFARTCSSYLYHWQAAAYRDGLNACGYRVDRFLFVVIDPLPPHPVEIYEIGETDLAQASMGYRGALEAFYRCHRHDNWPSSTNQIMTVTMPPWAKY
jgi:hypothetical protein